MASSEHPLDVVAVTLSGELGGRERILVDFAERAFESDVRLTAILPREGPLLEVLKGLGIAARVVAAPRRLVKTVRRDAPRTWGTRLRIAADLARWARALRREPAFTAAAVIYAITPEAYLAITLAGGRRRAVWHLHEYPPSPRWRWLRRRMARAVIANRTQVALAWEGKEETGRGKGWGKREEPLPGLSIIPSGIDLDRFHPAQPTGWLHERLGVGRAARLVGMPAIYARWKGQMEVIAAFEQVAPRFPDVHLVIVGGPIYETTAEEEYARQLLRRASGEKRGKGEEGRGKGGAGTLPSSLFPLPRQTALPTEGDTPDVSPRIHLTGFIRRIEPAFPEFAITVHYSLRPEPLGRPILESLACGVPVIAADEGGPRDLVRHGETGWLVAPRDVAALAQGLAHALSLPPERLAAMGAAARRDAEDRHSAREFARQVAGVLWGVGRR